MTDTTGSTSRPAVAGWLPMPVAVGLAVAALLAGWPAGADSSMAGRLAGADSSASRSGAAATPPEIHVQNYLFTPDTVTVEAGQPITWVSDETNEPEHLHLLHVIDHRGAWTVRLGPGETASITLQPSQYEQCDVVVPGRQWHCNISCILHPQLMLSSIDIVASAGASGGSSGSSPAASGSGEPTEVAVVAVVVVAAGLAAMVVLGALFVARRRHQDG